MTTHVPGNEWGFTNDPKAIEAVRAWRDAAVADGWSIKGTYEPSEGVERASRLKRDGFVCQILTRDNTEKHGKYKFEAAVHVWGPDGLALKVPYSYDMAALRSAVERCSYCGKSGIPTVRVGFAGRACVECQPTEERKLGPRYYD